MNIITNPAVSIRIAGVGFPATCNDGELSALEVSAPATSAFAMVGLSELSFTKS